MEFQEQTLLLSEGASSAAPVAADPAAPTLAEDLILLFVEMSVLILSFLALFSLIFMLA